MSVGCWDAVASEEGVYTTEYKRIRSVAWVLVLVWPIGLPLLYLALLLPVRKVIQTNHTSRLAKATTFLHREVRSLRPISLLIAAALTCPVRSRAQYEPKFLWWEVRYQPGRTRELHAR
jgi:hypothetical protein